MALLGLHSCCALAPGRGAAVAHPHAAARLARSEDRFAVTMQTNANRTSSGLRTPLTTAAAIACAHVLLPRPLLALGRAAAVPLSLLPAWLTLAPILRYASIPVVAGLLNWATNRLAIMMMFYPLRFRGIITRHFRVGWQGIVPGKAEQMANRIVDDVMLRLIDLKTVFARLPPERVALALEPLVLDVGKCLAEELVSRKKWGAFGAAAVNNAMFSSTLRSQGLALIADFVRDVQAEPSAVFDLRGVVVRGVWPNGLNRPRARLLCLPTSCRAPSHCRTVSHSSRSHRLRAIPKCSWISSSVAARRTSASSSTLDSCWAAL